MHSRLTDPGSAAPALRGAALALGSALLFGAATPLVQRFGAGVDAFVTASLLYAGAAGAGWLTRAPVEREAALRRADLPRLVLIAAFGAVVGPVALAWGLQHTSAASASLMLTLEAVFTALLARMFCNEQMGARVAAAMLAITAGGALLVLAQERAGGAGVAGLVAVTGATLAWAADNTLSRALAQRDPGRTVLAKSSLGACAAALVAAALGAPRPSPVAVLGLLAVGALGYGLSLRLYLLAQRAFGAGRTASVFAFAPFVGAALAVVLGDRSASPTMLAGGALVLGGVLLHLFERHAHVHVHEAHEHEHAHTHDDGHHTHVHEPMPERAHSHWHRHELLVHAHPHVPDVHHTHRHD